MKSIHDKAGVVDSDEALERLFELSVLLADGMERGLAEQGLTRSRAEVIWRLQRGGPATQRELSEALRCTPRNVTGLVDALEAAALVARRHHPTDRRATVVSLTPRGRKTASAWQSEYRKLASHLFGDFGARDRARLTAGLEQVLEKLRTPRDMPEAKRRQPKGADPR